LPIISCTVTILPHAEGPSLVSQDDIIKFVMEADHFRTAYAIVVAPSRSEVGPPALCDPCFMIRSLKLVTTPAVSTEDTLKTT